MSTIGGLLYLLGEPVATLACAPRGLDRPFDRVVIHDPLDLTPGQPGDLLLGVGLTVGSIPVVAALTPPPCAMLMRGEARMADALIARAGEAGIAIVFISPDVSWASVAELALALTTADSSPDGVSAATPAASELIEELFALATSIADLVQAPITIEDNESRLLAYSPLDEGADEARTATILGHRVPAAFRREARSAGVSKRLLTDTEPFYLTTGLANLKPRVILALRAREEVLGSMWAMTDGPFTKTQNANFARAGATVSARLLRHRLATDIRRRQHAATLTRILAGDPATAELGASIGLTGAAFRIMAFGFADGARPVALERAADSLTMQLSVAHSGAISALGDGAIHALIPCHVDAVVSRRQCREIFTVLRSALPAQHRGGLLAGIGRPSAALRTVGTSRVDADLALRALRSRTPEKSRAHPVAEVDDVATDVLLQQLADVRAANPAPASTLDTLEGYDAQNGTHYLETLRAHLTSFGDPTRASDELAIHTNTLRYRLKRLLELFAIDLGDPDTRLALLIELRLDDRR